MDTEPATVLKRTLHLIEEPEGWNLVEGEEARPLSRFETKAQAMAEARRLAIERGVEVVVHGADGSVQERDMFVR